MVAFGTETRRKRKEEEEEEIAQRREREGRNAGERMDPEAKDDRHPIFVARASS